MKILNACNCPDYFVDFIRTAIKKSGFEVIQVEIYYCDPKEIYLSLVFYDEADVADVNDYSAWREREFRIAYKRLSKILAYSVFRGLELDAPFVYGGRYKHPEGSFANVGKYYWK